MTVRLRGAAFAAAPAAAGVATMLLLSSAIPGGVRAPAAAPVLLGLAALALTWWLVRTAERRDRFGMLMLLALGAAAMTMGSASLVAVAGYLRIPADILAFSETTFIGDIIKLQQGLPIFTPGPDNNSYPYMPGAQILTLGLASLFEPQPSIAMLRMVQFGYVVLAVLVAAWTVLRLATLLRRDVRGDSRAVWFVCACGLLLLVALDPNFNLYNHALHNDGLALLVSVTAFGVLARHLVRPSVPALIALAVVPAAGFAVKQSLLIWAPLAGMAVLAARPRDWRQVLGLWATSAALVAGIIAFGYVRWGGDDFLFWIFDALGQKRLSPARSIEHFLSGGVYAVMLVVTAFALRRYHATRVVWVLFATASLLLLVESYTSGIGFVRNHMGPGVVLASCWLLAVALVWWPSPVPRGGGIEVVAAVATLLLVFPGIGLLRQPRDPVPADVARYIADIEAEFVGMDPSRVLADAGSWVYYRHGVVMRDRAFPLALHLGINQRRIDSTMLAGTLERFSRQQYDRILARDVDGPYASYDYGRPDGVVRATLLRHYHVVRRIRGVEVTQWWPRSLLGDVFVLEPRREALAPAADARNGGTP